MAKKCAFCALEAAPPAVGSGVQDERAEGDRFLGQRRYDAVCVRPEGCGITRYRAKSIPRGLKSLRENHGITN